MSDEQQVIEQTEEEKAFLAGLAEDPSDHGLTTSEHEEGSAGEGVDTGQGSPQPASQEDDLASLPEEIRDRFKALQSRTAQLESDLVKTKDDYQAAVGRLAPIQRKLADFERQRQTVTQAPPVIPIAANPPQTAEELDALIQTEEFKRYSEMFPEEAKIFKNVTQSTIKAAEKIAERIVDERVSAALQQVQSRYEPLVETVNRDREDRDLQARIAQLEKEHPDWREYNGSEEFGQFFFNEYLPRLPAMLRDQFSDDANVREALRDPDFTSTLLRDFKATRGIGQQQQAQPAQQPQVRLQMAVQPAIKPSVAPRPTRVDAMTPEQAFLAGYNADT
jgi:hypothetical protein